MCCIKDIWIQKAQNRRFHEGSPGNITSVSTNRFWAKIDQLELTLTITMKYHSELLMMQE